MTLETGDFWTTGSWRWDVNTSTPTACDEPWPAEWLTKVLGSIQSLGALPENWDSYGANRVDQRSLDFAQARVRQIAVNTNCEPTVTATPGGCVNLAWRWDADSKSLEIEFRPDGRMHYAFVDLTHTSGDTENVVRLLGELLHLIPGT